MAFDRKGHERCGEFLERIRGELQAVHRKLGTVDERLRELLQWQRGSFAVNVTDPCVFQVVDRGECCGPFTDDELRKWRNEDFDLLFDTIRNVVSIRDPKTQSLLSTPFGPHTKRRELGSVLGLLQVLAEHPGQRLTDRLLAAYPGQPLREKNTLAKYIKRIRAHLGDTRPFHLILTDEGVATGCSLTGCAYYANPDFHWRVIRLLPSLLSS